MILPTVHLNGTSRDVLIEQRTDIVDALAKAIEKMRVALPHGRDYYPQGEHALLEARKVANDRITQIRVILDDVNSEAYALYEAGRE